MDEQSAQTAIPDSQNLNENQFPKNSPKQSIVAQFKELSLITKASFSLGLLIALIFIVLLISTLFQDSNKSTIGKQDEKIVDSVEKQKQKQEQASIEALRKQAPQNQLQQAYADSVGSDSSKRVLTLDSSGIATIEYEIASKDGATILRTSYENFADLAKRVFNIPTINRLNVTTYANKFTDAFGKPNVFAVKLELTKETNLKINWSVKKFAYADYANILDKHEINPDLAKDYKALTKSN